MRLFQFSLFFILSLFAQLVSADTVQPNASPVIIGMDAEFGHRTSTSDDAIRAGILIAIDEINAAGGVLGGRKLELLERDNRSVPARGVANLKAFAEVPDLVGVFCGKFSPVVIEELPAIHELRIPLLDPWAAADKVVDNGRDPNYVFRLSLRDSWAVPTMLNYLKDKGLERIGILVPNTAWGRGNHKNAISFLESNSALKLTTTQWYNWGDNSLLAQYRELLRADSQAVLLVANEREGSILLREIASLPHTEQLPIASHWGVTGGNFHELAGNALEKLDFAVVQTYSFIDAQGPIAERVIAAATKLTGAKDASDIISPVGLAHAYDLTHVLARAIDIAGTTDRIAVRNALEQVRDYQGLIRHYEQPFSPESHEALVPELVFMARYLADGTLQPLRKPQ